MSDDFDQYLEEEFLASDGGGGGYVCEVQLRPGFKVFVTGHADDTSFFPIVADNVAVQETAAAAFAEANGKKKVHRAAQLLLFGDTVINREKPAWSNDNVRLISSPTFTAGSKELLNSLRELRNGELLWNKKFWAHVSYKPEPTGRQRLGQSGQMEDELIPYFVHVFADEAEARAYVGADPVAPDGLTSLYEKYSENAILNQTTIDAAFREIAKAIHDGKDAPAIYRQLFDATDLEVMVELAKKMPPF